MHPGETGCGQWDPSGLHVVISSSWTNLNNKHSWVAEHDHLAHLSGVYYISPGNGADSEDNNAPGIAGHGTELPTALFITDPRLLATRFLSSRV